MKLSTLRKALLQDAYDQTPTGVFNLVAAIIWAVFTISLILIVLIESEE